MVPELSLSPTLTNNFFVPRGQVVCPPNPGKGTPTASKSFSVYYNFLRHSSAMISTELPVSTHIRHTMAVPILSWTTCASLWGPCNGRVSSGPKITVGPNGGFNSLAAITWLSCQIWAFLYPTLNFFPSMPPIIIAINFIFRLESSFFSTSTSCWFPSIPFPGFRKRLSYPRSTSS